jgi:plasmid maintenance system antidote protein VapI
MSNQKQAEQEANPFEQFFQAAEKSTSHWIELAKLEFTEEVVTRMKELGVGKSDLAAKLSARPSMVTRLLSGKNNFELATMVRLARALDCDYKSHLQPHGTKTCWINVLKEAPLRQQSWNPKQFQKMEKFQPRIVPYEVPAAARTTFFYESFA